MKPEEKDLVLAEIDKVQLASVDGDGPFGSVYFIVCHETGRCKIGFTTGHPAKRLASLQTGSATELALIAIHPGTLATERALHEKFASSRIRGEWFEITVELRAYLVVTVWAMTELTIKTGHRLPVWMQVGVKTIMDSLGVISEDLAELLDGPPAP